MNDLDRLIAIEAIKKLKARYFRYVDMRADDETRATLFTPDATLHFPEKHPEPMSFAETRKWASSVVDESVSVHHGHLPEIEILSETTARAIWPMEDRLYWKRDRGPGQPISQHGFGYYVETYERLDGAWKIKTLKLTRLRVVYEYAPQATAPDAQMKQA
jgi:hypothetical protein